MKSKFPFFIVMLAIIFATLLCSGCIGNNGTPSYRVPETNTSAAALVIALDNDTVQSLLAGGYSVQSIEPSTVGINQMTVNVTSVIFGTPMDSVGVNVDVKNNSIVNIWTLPKRVPMPGSYNV
jgi:hypothetical protein